jgi:histidinol dehydrogenase
VAVRLDASAPDFARAFERLLARVRAPEADVGSAVRAIVADVRERGDAALLDLTEKFDGAKVSPAELRVSKSELASADRSCDPMALSALDHAARRIEAYHRRQLPKGEWYTDEAGVQLGWRWTPLDSVGLYAPGGTASYPSSVLMNAIPARLAGVRRIAMATPANKGRINPLVLAAAKRAGVSEVYRVGGAQAVAALAYGTETVAAVDKIVGPGNAYVAAAKREVFGHVGIDSIAGPSEILVVADASANPYWIAADLLSQAEHDESSQSIMITDSAEFANRVEQAVDRALALLPRRDIAGASWRDHGAIIVVGTLADAAPLIDRIAPEHLELATADPDALLPMVRHAGAIFLGPHTPEAIGDYIAGPNHVLPTSRTARFSSGLSVLDFMKHTTLLRCDRASIGHLGPDAIALAESEGLQAHAQSVAARLNSRP